MMRVRPIARTASSTPEVSPHLQVDAELQTSSGELGLRGREGGTGIARLPLDHDRAERRVGQVREREHETVDLEHLRAHDLRPAGALGGHQSRRESFGPIHVPRSTTAVCQGDAR